MDIPESIRAALAAADDDYLVGLSNKGTVNRAKKDLLNFTPTAEAAGEMVVLTMGGETVMLLAPLGKSMCSCPSSSICRHRIGAMLWLRDQAGTAEPPKPEFGSLKAYPAEKLAKQLGQKRVSGILFRHRSGSGPHIEQSTTIRVELPWYPEVVRLLDPVEDSTCSCRSRSFCNHRAEALLYWQLKNGIAKADELEPKEDTMGPDPERTKGVCASVCQMLAEQMAAGLSRMPEETLDTVERMASLSHTAQLPDLERALRNLHGEYAAYFARSATFRETALLERLSRAFRLAERMERSEGAELRKLAGAFRDEYTRVKDLKLYLLGMREYVGRSGYGGTIYYFFERDTHEFYTFRDLRPNYYETKRRNPDAAPWSMPCTLRKAWNCAFDLKGPRVNDSGNLSATKETEAVYLGSAKPWLVVQNECICHDFTTLVEKSAPNRQEIDRLVVIKPKKVELRRFDMAEQVFSMGLYDAWGRDIRLEVRYSSQEEKVVQMLEQLARQVRRGAEPPVFFGMVYREDDLIKFYPIEFFTDWEVRP